MAQLKSWEKEYRKPQLVTKSEKPQNDILRFYRWLKKEAGLALSGLKILDLGAGTGRNSIYITELGNRAVGMEISDTALKLARARAGNNKSVEFIKHSIGEPYPFSDNEFDLLLDMTSSNSLTDDERQVYLRETKRVLKPGGYFFVRALCLEADKNAKKLLKSKPGPEPDTYIFPELNLVEKVFTQESFIATYKPFFEIKELFRKTSYQLLNNQSYKRNFWLAYLNKR